MLQWLLMKKTFTSLPQWRWWKRHAGPEWWNSSFEMLSRRTVVAWKPTLLVYHPQKKVFWHPLCLPDAWLVWILVALVNVKARVIFFSYPLQQLKSPPQPEWPIENGLRQPIWDTVTSLCPLPLFLWTHNKVVSLSGAAHLNRRSGRSATMAMGNGDWDWT